MAPAIAIGLTQFVGLHKAGSDQDSISLVRGLVPGPWRGSERGLHKEVLTTTASVVTGIKFRALPSAPNRYLATFWSPDGKLQTWGVTDDLPQNGWLRVQFRTKQPTIANKTYKILYWAWPGQHSGQSVKGNDVAVLFDTSAGGVPATPTPAIGATTAAGPSAKPKPKPVTAPTKKPTSPAEPPVTGAPSPAGWPGPANTGVPAGTSLTPYTGPCRITTANTVIDAKSVSCTLDIETTGVKISRSKLVGGVSSPTDGAGSFTLTDSTVVVQPNETGVGETNFVVERSDISGGNRGVNCYDHCTVKDSWVHGTRISGPAHASGMRAGMNTTYDHNTVACDVQDNAETGGCSADITMYGDFSTVEYVTIENNLFVATPGGFCGYGGSSAGKPYPNPNHVVFIGNVFQHGKGGKCGFWGAVTSFSSSAPGNVWRGNTWDDKSVAQPS